MAYGSGIWGFFYTLESTGFFDLVLPFLLIFAIIYAILTKTKILGGEDYKGINAIVGIAVGLLALRLPYVSVFFSEIFPRMGIGLAVLLVALIFLGLFSNLKRGGPRTVLYILGAVIAVVVTLSAFSSYNWWYSNFWQMYMDWIIIGIIVAIVIGVIMGQGKSSGEKKGFWGLVPQPDTDY